jgi:hypothetical protein
VAVVADTPVTLEMGGVVGESHCRVTFTASAGIPAAAEVVSVEVYTGQVVTLEAGDIEIGAVELKDATTATRAKIGAGTGIVAGDAAIAVKDPAIGQTTGAAVETDAAGTVQQYLRGLVKNLVPVFGATTGAAVITDAVGTVQQYLRGLVTLIAGMISAGLKLAAGEAHVGEFGGRLIINSDSFDALAAGDYAANDVVSADAETTATTPLRGITVARVNGGAGYLVLGKLTNEIAAWVAGMRMDLYTVAQPTTALTGDNVASAPKFANDGQYISSIEFSILATPTGSDLRRQVRDDIRIPFKCAVADTKVYYRLVTLAAETNETGSMQWNVTLGAEAY